LNEQALNVFDNEINIDFLVDNFDDEVGISIDMFDFDLNEEITQLETRYYEEHYINISGFDVTLDDILVKKPKKEGKILNKEGMGYMITRLISLEPYFILQEQYKKQYCINTTIFNNWQFY